MHTLLRLCHQHARRKQFLTSHPIRVCPISAPFASAALNDSSEVVVNTGRPLTVNVLNNTATAPGANATMTTFTLPGSNITYPAGPTPVDIPGVGSIVMLPNGTANFTPTPGYIGSVPPITYTVMTYGTSQTKSTLTISSTYSHE